MRMTALVLVARAPSGRHLRTFAPNGVADEIWEDELVSPSMISFDSLVR